MVQVTFDRSHGNAEARRNDAIRRSRRNEGSDSLFAGRQQRLHVGQYVAQRSAVRESVEPQAGRAMARAWSSSKSMS